MEIADSTYVKVRNLADHTVAFTDEDTHRRFSFQPYEEKNIKAEVLRRLNYRYGGSVLLRDYLSVGSPNLAREFGIDPEETIEYSWTEKDVNKLLSSGSLDQLKDALDFGPEGICDLIIDRAVATKLNDVDKRKVIKEMTGADITSMIDLQAQADAKLEKPAAKTTKTRRASTKSSTGTSGRRSNKTKGE